MRMTPFSRKVDAASAVTEIGWAPSFLNAVGLIVALGCAAGAAHGAEIQSISRLAFGPSDTLFVADWVESRVHALNLPRGTPDAGRPFNVLDLDAELRRALGSSDITIQDLAHRPGTSEVYIAVSMGATSRPAIVMVTPDGHVQKLDLRNIRVTDADLDRAPDPSLAFWNGHSARSFTVTDMKWHDGKLYLAGLSNQTFASTLRVIPYPFSGERHMASIEMYHTSHDQIETRAPIRAMTFAELDGKPYLIAAYLCTPLVTIPVESLVDGAHVRAKTIAELGDAGIPVDMISYSAMDFATHKQVPFVLVANVFREGSIIPLDSIVEANRGSGYSKPVSFGAIAGVQRTGATLDNALRVDNQDDHFLIAIRRDLATGHAELVSVDKLAGFRLSDFDVSEFMFPGYRYASDPEHDGIRQMQNMLKTEEGFPAAIVR